MKAFLLASLTFLAVVSSVRAADEVATPLALGASAPDFNLPGVDGRNYSLKDFASSKVLAVIFTCTHCPSAQYYEERIKQLVVDYKSKGVAIVAIMPNDPKSIRLDELGWTDLSDTFPEMKLRAKDRNFNFPYLFDGENEKVSRAYGPAATPHIFIFDQDRKLRYAGAIDDSERIQKMTRSYAREVLDALLADKAPPITNTKVVGCSIKWAGKEDSVKTYLAKVGAEPVSLTNADSAIERELRKNASGKFRLVNFWSTTAPASVATFDEFVTINRMYRHRDFEVVTVSLDQPNATSDVLAFLKKHEASMRDLILPVSGRDEIFKSFDPAWRGEAPFTVLIDPTGKIVYKESGSVDSLAIKRAIVPALNAIKPW